MSDRMTAIHLPGRGHGSGLADWGRRPPDEMIQQLRTHAAHRKEEAEAILAAADEDFRIETFVGQYARNKLEVLRPGRLALSDSKENDRG